MDHFQILTKIIDSKDFTAGGGSASAIAGAMAAGMAAMVARLSINKDCGLSGEKYEEIADEADRISKELLRGSVEDNEAYLLIVNAYALPKLTEEEKAARREAIQNAGIKAASVPLENGKRCKRVYELCLMLKERSNPNAASDLAEAEMLSYSGVMGCALNIDANLSLIKDEKIKSEFEEQSLKLKQISY
jgi:methenyltetrahydrofolate cyclohydrolase